MVVQTLLYFRQVFISLFWMDWNLFSVNHYTSQHYPETMSYNIPKVLAKYTGKKGGWNLTLSNYSLLTQAKLCLGLPVGFHFKYRFPPKVVLLSSMSCHVDAETILGLPGTAGTHMLPGLPHFLFHNLNEAPWTEESNKGQEVQFWWWELALLYFEETSD